MLTLAHRYRAAFSAIPSLLSLKSIGSDKITSESSSRGALKRKSRALHLRDARQLELSVVYHARTNRFARFSTSLSTITMAPDHRQMFP